MRSCTTPVGIGTRTNQEQWVLETDYTAIEIEAYDWKDLQKSPQIFTNLGINTNLFRSYTRSPSVSLVTSWNVSTKSVKNQKKILIKTKMMSIYFKTFKFRHLWIMLKVQGLVGPTIWGSSIQSPKTFVYPPDGADNTEGAPKDWRQWFDKEKFCRPMCLVECRLVTNQISI